MHYTDMNNPFFDAARMAGLSTPISRWLGWDIYDALWCMGGEL